MYIPKALEGLNFVTPPNEFLEFAKRFGVQHTVFVEDEKCERSLRYNNDIFVKITGKWDVYTLYPFEAKTFNEMITLRFLHEVGHVFHKHSGSLMDTQKLNMPQAKDLWREILHGDEGQAWMFAFKIRKYYKNDYDKLICSFENFIKTYNYRSSVC